MERLVQLKINQEKLHSFTFKNGVRPCGFVVRLLGQWVIVVDKDLFR